MTNRVIGPGVGLPAPQALYPSPLSPVAYTAAANEVTLAAGQSIQIPAGDFIIDLGKYSILEFQDPVAGPVNTTQLSGIWRPIRVQRGTFQIRSDGVNYRISNLLGCAVAAVVTAGGATYLPATTTVTPSIGNSTWEAIIGGRITVPTCSAVGAGYGVAPLVFISAPPNPGVQATAIATIAAGAINGFTLINEGAGYTVAPTITIAPNPYDPNLNSITPATAILSGGLTGAGAVSAVLCTNHGVPVATTMTLAIAGGNSSATVVPQFLTTLASLTVAAIGSGTFLGAALTTYGGIPTSTPAFKNPAVEYTDFLPRQALVTLAATTGNITPGSASTVIIDGGMFLGTASPLVNVYGGTIQTAPTVTLTQGSASDTVLIQPM